MKIKVKVSLIYREMTIQATHCYTDLCVILCFFCIYQFADQMSSMKLDERKKKRKIIAKVNQHNLKS